MEHDPLISVIVPVYNVENYLSRCVDSILAQTYRELEVILVDDGATDGSGAICDDYAQADPRVRVIHKENGGLSSARNAGIDTARGEYLAFVDSDDWIEPETYDTLLSRLQSWGALMACGGRYDVDGATGNRRVGLCPEKDECIDAEKMVERIFLWQGCDSSACDKLYHRSLFASFRYPHGRVCEDVPVTYQIVLKAGKVALCARPFYNYFHRPGSITGAAVSEKTFHFSQHTAQIYENIRENYPGVLGPARYLRVRSLAYDLLTLDLAGREIRGKFREQYRSSRRELGRHSLFILTSPYFHRQERLTDLLLVVGLYRPFRRVYHKLRGR